MFESIPIVNYQSTHLKSLLALTDKLYSNNVFESYLTPQQLVLLEYILSIKNDETREKIWNELMNANLVLNVITILDSQKDDQQSIDETVPNSQLSLSNTSENNDESHDDESNNEITLDKANADINQLDLTDLSQHITTPGFIGNLSMKIRYVLWQCVIDIAYKSTDSLEFLGDDKKQDEGFDYVLLDDISDEAALSKDEAEIETEQNNAPPKSTNDDSDDDSDDDNYDDDEDEDDYDGLELTAKKTQKLPTTAEQNVNIETDEQSRLVLTVEISTDTLLKLRTNNFNAIMGNWTKTYHSYEYDKETMMKRLKLEANNELLENEKDKKRPLEAEDDETEAQHGNTTDEHSSDYEDDKHSTKRPKRDSVSLPVNLGIANLSLKHLLNSIQTNKSKLKLSDYELKTLITDVRKNRSKWTSDDRIGQEELYEACEKVVLELRNYTEHSTPFLNKVSKREAPNYHLIIKKSMDLNTVLKKLKTFQYDSKQEFVDDIMLIWKNCLTYNSDPSHFLRAHAIAMQKKSLQLIPMIPNITIRSRAEVERELAELERDKEYEDEADEEVEVAGSGRKGLNMGAHKPAGGKTNSTGKTTEPTTEEHQEDNSHPVDKSDDENETENELLAAGDSQKYNSKEEAQPAEDSTEVHEIEGESNDAQTSKIKMEHKNDAEYELHENSAQVNPVDENEKKDSVNKVVDGPISSEKDSPSEHTIKDQDVANEQFVKSEEEKKTEEEDLMAAEAEDKNQEVEAADDDDEDEEDDDEEGGEDNQTYMNDGDDDRDDIELSIWKSATAKSRAEICLRRSRYFTNGRINSMSEALLKNPSKLKDYSQLWQEYKDQKEIEAYQQQLEQDSIMKNGFGPNVKEEESEQPEVPETTSVLFGDKAATEIDYENAILLQEYDIVNGLPNLEYKGVPSEVLDEQENIYVNGLLQSGETYQSIYQKNKDKGMNVQMNENISLIQQIRHICHKISLIRMLQTPQYLQNNKNPSGINISKHKYNYTEIDDSIDIDPVSQLRTHDYRNNKELIWRIMHKNVSKISMASGFETAQPSAINILTDIAGDYLSNLIKTIKLHHESNTLNTKDSIDILNLTLLENGIQRPDLLYSYLESEFTKKSKKLRDMRSKLEVFLKDLLRPTLQELSERNFEDESENFVTGNFANELTGEDFFGFKELGLEKEFGMLSSSVPLQLLTTQFQANENDKKVQINKVQPEEIESINYYRLTKRDVESNHKYSFLKPMLEKAYKKSRIYSLKPNKNTPEAKTSQEDPDSDSYVILEDEEMPQKKGSSKLRLPPTGKISVSYKKAPIANAFFIPEVADILDGNVPESKEGNSDSNNTNSNPSNQPSTPSQDPKIENSFLSQDSTENPLENGSLLLDSNLKDITVPFNDSFSLELPKVE